MSLTKVSFSMINGASVNVKDFGAIGNGIADDSDAIQATFDYIAANQFPTPGFDQWTYNVCAVFFPQGTYKITRQISVSGLVVIYGVGSAYVASSTIRQYATDTNIFSMDVSGSDVYGLNFEFATNAGNSYGYALAYSASASSNSHRIHDNRCNGFYRYGRFLLVEGSNDVEINNNTIDVCSPGQAIVIGSQSNNTQCSDVRISGNNFFDCDDGVVIYNAKSVFINDNVFSNQYSTGSAIKLTTDANTITANSVFGITIANNTFWRQYSALSFDGSASDVIYSDNNHVECLARPLVALGATNCYNFKFHNNYFHLSVAGTDPYPYTYAYTSCPFFSDEAIIYNSEFCDNTVNANGINTVTRFFAPETTYVFGSGMVIRNNKIINNTSYPGAYLSFVPMSADELTITNNQTFTNYPVSQPVFNFNTEGIALGDQATFYVDYVVVCNKTGVTAGSKVGTVKVSFARLSASTTDTKFNVTSIASVGDDTGGSGTDIPTVAFSGFSTGSASGLLVTVSGAITATFTTSVKVKAYGFMSVGTAQIQSA